MALLSENDLDDIARTQRVHGDSNLRRMVANLQPARRRQHQDRQPVFGQVLLIAQALIGRDQRIERLFCRRLTRKFRSGAGVPWSRRILMPCRYGWT